MTEPLELEVQAMLDNYLADLDAHVCPQCKASIIQFRQVGRCVYASPCGHRLYQGKVPKDKG